MAAYGNVDIIEQAVRQHWELCPAMKGRHRGVWSVRVVDDEPQFPVIWECEECGAVIDDPDLARARRQA